MTNRDTLLHLNEMLLKNEMLNSTVSYNKPWNSTLSKKKMCYST